MGSGGDASLAFEVPGTLAALDLAQRLQVHGAEVAHESEGISLVTAHEPDSPADLASVLDSVATWAAGWQIPSLAVRLRGRVYELRPPVMGHTDATPEEIDELLALPLDLD